MLKSFKEFLLREEEEKINKYDKGPMVDFLNNFDENTLNPPLNGQQISNCYSFIYKGIDKNKDGIMKRDELDNELDSQNIAFFCLSFKMKPKALISSLKKFFYYDVIYQRLGKDGLDMFTLEDGKIKVKNASIKWMWSAEPFYKKIYVYKDGKIFIEKTDPNAYRKSSDDLEESFLNKDSLKEDSSSGEEEEEKGAYAWKEPYGKFTLTEVGEKLQSVMKLIAKEPTKELFSDDVLRDFTYYTDIEKLFKKIDIKEVEDIMKNPPRRNPFKNDSNYDQFTSPSSSSEDSKEALEKALKKKPKVKLRDGTYDTFVSGDDTSINANDKDGNAVGVFGFNISTPKEADIRNKSFEEIWNGNLKEIKDQLLERLDKVCIEYLKTHFAKQLSYEVKEEKILDFKFSKYKSILNEESDFVKNIGLTKDMLKNEQKRHEVLNKLIDSTLSLENKEFKETKNNAKKFTEKVKDKKAGKFVSVLVAKAQYNFRHVAYIAANLLKKTKQEMDQSVSDLPNNLTEIFNRMVEDLNKTGDDAFLVARYVFVAIIDRFKNDSSYIAKIMSGRIPLTEVFKKLNLGKEGIVYESTCKIKKPFEDDRQVLYQDTVRFKTVKQLFGENSIRYWNELDEEEAVNKLLSAISSDQKFKDLSSNGTLVKNANAYIQAYNAVSKAITSTPTEATINLNGYVFDPNKSKDIKNIALRQRMAKFALFQKEANSDIYIIIRNEEANAKLQELKQQQNIQGQQPQQTTQQPAEQQQTTETQSKPNATVTTAAVDSTYPPPNAYKKRMREIIYRKGPYTIKYKD